MTTTEDYLHLQMEFIWEATPIHFFYLYFYVLNWSVDQL